MANYSVSRSKHATLTTTTPDVVTLTGVVSMVQVINRTGAAPLYFKVGSTDPGSFVSEADDTLCVMPGVTADVPWGAGGAVVRVVGSANAYTVQAVTNPHAR